MSSWVRVNDKRECGKECCNQDKFATDDGKFSTKMEEESRPVKPTIFMVAEDYNNNESVRKF